MTSGESIRLASKSKKWRYLYRAVDSDGHTLDFLLTAKRDTKAAKHFLNKALNAVHTHEPRVINVDKNPAYPPAIEQLPFINQIFGLAA